MTNSSSRIGLFLQAIFNIKKCFEMYYTDVFHPNTVISFGFTAPKTHLGMQYINQISM